MHPQHSGGIRVGVETGRSWAADPFGFLGRHGGVVRAYQPGAAAVEVIARKTRRRLATLTEVEPGLFEGELKGRAAYAFRIIWPDGPQEIEDVYGFGPVLSDEDLTSIAGGDPLRLAERLGATPRRLEEVDGVSFSVWAPNARRVGLVGDFNGWDGRRHPMRLRHDKGVWEIFIPRLSAGERYQFEIEGADGVVRRKADPLARATEAPPATASIVAPVLDHAWADEAWMAARGERQHPGAPISIYEVHAGSWRRPWDGRQFHDWDELADQLIPYVAGLGFTHLQLMPIMEHPFGGSWGYQPLSQFASSARYGSPAALARFVDRCHQAGLGVILDWVPAHFPNDAHGLERFDGTALYEHDDPTEGFHPDWNTLIYNLGREEVQAFLIASALHWLDRFHIDGLRVDAVASMLYRDYSRAPGQWKPNIHGGRENLEAVAFLQRLNATVADRFPTAITIAEESTSWPGVTAPVDQGGLGFTYKWNMGWMNDTLRYMHRDPVHRGWHGGDIGFGLVYAFSEKFILPLSHDEVVHGKGALVAKMPGDRWRQFANLRALLALMWAHPGKKLLFMGGEFGQLREWNHDRELDWALLEEADHHGLQRLVGDLNRIYRDEGALHHTDADPRGFSWIAENNDGDGVFLFERRSFHGGAPLVMAVNMTPMPRERRRVAVPLPGRWTEILNTDAGFYGGGDLGNQGGVTSFSAGDGEQVELTLPPLAAIFLRYEGP
ncbi:1,4-alpha-glucan branching enzyme [Caulobacter flavus]|uniref:1,4-alpha-glucan branching enzyme GlgB n=1 Tax=Caulobacter flavus TaxID=1679497 RepID=A0A2N5CKF7_9CAUL|nr:1,4-alpha-glucan branching enzyme [Caulobacter flavus]PLR05811.1 1,4-alpha-glucan branching enzyme [Caulobacter flavus]